AEARRPAVGRCGATACRSAPARGAGSAAWGRCSRGCPVRWPCPQCTPVRRRDQLRAREVVSYQRGRTWDRNGTDRAETAETADVRERMDRECGPQSHRQLTYSVCTLVFACTESNRTPLPLSRQGDRRR